MNIPTIAMSREDFDRIPTVEYDKTNPREGEPRKYRCNTGQWILNGHESSPAVLEIQRPIRPGEKPALVQGSSRSPELDSILRRKRKGPRTKNQAKRDRRKNR